MSGGELNLRRLQYFMVLAEELHFGRAAARLHIAQPGLSQQIKQLEAEIGTPLLERLGRENRLTPAGELLRSEARRILQDCEQVLERVRALGDGASGQLTIAYTRSAVYLGTTELVRDFRAQRPDVKVRTTSAWTSRNLDMLHDGEVDAAFVRSPVDDPTLDFVELWDEELVAVLSPGHPLIDVENLRPEALWDENIVFWPREYGPGHWDRITGQIWPDGGPRIVLVEPDDEQILAAVAVGIGISVLERARASRLAPPDVTLRRFSDPVPTCGLALAWRASDVSPGLQAFIDECRATAAASKAGGGLRH